MAQNKHIVYFVARVGGWDGIAMQAEIWMEILLDLGYQITLVTGEVDTEPGPLDQSLYGRINLVVLDQLQLDVQGQLFNAAKRGVYDRDTWLPEFINQKIAIKTEFADLIKDADKVFLHNFSIKHLVPTAWAAMHELMTENTQLQFIALDADSPYERAKILETLAPDYIEILGNPAIWNDQNIEQMLENLHESQYDHNNFLPGPDMLPNLYHICLNTAQRRVAQNIYGIDDTHIATLPDIGLFVDQCHDENCTEQRQQVFFEYLTGNKVLGSAVPSEESVYVISPVRPIERKKLKEVARACKALESYIRNNGEQRDVILVVTHPNMYESEYFEELKGECGALGLTLIHTDNLLLRKKEDSQDFTYNELMYQFSQLYSVSMVGSEFGGWENGILESTEYKIPVVVNPHLPSYQDMSSFGLEYIPMPIEQFTKEQEEDASRAEHFFEKIALVLFDAQKRKENVECNFKVGEREQSSKTASRLIQEVFGR